MASKKPWRALADATRAGDIPSDVAIRIANRWLDTEPDAPPVDTEATHHHARSGEPLVVIDRRVRAGIAESLVRPQASAEPRVWLPDGLVVDTVAAEVWRGLSEPMRVMLLAPAIGAHGYVGTTATRKALVARDLLTHPERWLVQYTDLGRRVAAYGRLLNRGCAS